MGRRNEHTREELREIALRAAEELVAVQGLAGLSTRAAVSCIGYSGRKASTWCFAVSMN